MINVRFIEKEKAKILTHRDINPNMLVLTEIEEQIIYKQKTYEVFSRSLNLDDKTLDVFLVDSDL